VGQIVQEVQAGFASGEKGVEGGVPQLRMNNIGLRGELVLDLVRTVPEILARPHYDLRVGDVLVCMTNSADLVGKCTLFDLPGRYVFSNHLTRLRTNPEAIDGGYLRWYLWLQWKTGVFDDSCKHWVNQSALPKEALVEAEVAVAPIAEQRRIVSQVEALLGRVRSSQERLVKTPTTLKRFRQAVVAAACTAKLTADWRRSKGVPGSDGVTDDVPSGWRPVCVGDVIDNLKYGTAQKCTPEKRGTPVLRIPNVAKGTIDHTDLKYAVLPPKERESLRLIPGDILIIRSNGSVALVGRSALVRKQEQGFVYAGYLIRIRPRRKVIKPEFLNLVLGSYDVRLQIELEARSTSGVNNINSEEVRALQFLLPPVEEQDEIVRRVEALLSVGDRLEGRYAKAKTQVDRLTQSVLAKAFRGELVMTEAELARREGREYETAEELLARIKRERAGAESLPHRRARNGTVRRRV
jgi:type I restriction enzyme S subunit